MTRHRPTLVLLLALLAAASPVTAAPPGSAPGATLLLPYFEVHPGDPEALTTLFSVNNAGSQPVVAHVVVWTDWGIPTYSFDLALGPDHVETINLRDLFATGSVPATDGGGIDGCSNPVAVPPLSASDLAALRARHAGRPDPGDGLCYGSDVGAGKAVGYVTVDVARTCAGPEVFAPGDPGYFFVDFGGVPLPNEGFVAYDNVLWGDAFYVAGAENSAQGVELVQVPFEEEAVPGETFYRIYTDTDGRAKLGSRYRGRYLEGGPFDAGTDLLVWLEGSLPSEPAQCGLEGAVVKGTFVDPCQSALFSVYDQEGNLLTETLHDGSRLAFRLRVGSEGLPAPEPFGFFELDHWVLEGCHIIPSGTFPMQAWVTPVMKAGERFSVGLPATRIPLPAD